MLFQATPGYDAPTVVYVRQNLPYLLLCLNWISGSHKESFIVQALGQEMHPIEFFDLGLFSGYECS